MPDLINNPFYRMEEEWHIHSGSSFSIQRLLIATDMLKQGLQLTGRWRVPYVSPNPDPTCNFQNPEICKETAEQMLDNAEKEHGQLPCSSACESLISAMVEILPVWAAENT
jgi:hypothetical protein